MNSLPTNQLNREGPLRKEAYEWIVYIGIGMVLVPELTLNVIGRIAAGLCRREKGRRDGAVA